MKLLSVFLSSILLDALETYQRKKLLKFFYQFQRFSDFEFRSPVIRIKNQTSKHTSFYTFENKYDFRLKFAIIESISHQLSTRDLFNRLKNQNKSSMKNNLIQQFQHLKDDGFI